MIFVLTLVLLIYGSINAYIGLRTWQWLQVIAPFSMPSPLYWLVFWLVACSFLLARLVAGRVPLWLSNVLAQVGGYWLAIMFYSVPLLVLVDLIRLVDYFTGLLAVVHLSALPLVAITGTLICAVIGTALIYGTWRARNPVVTSYALTIPKQAGAYQELNIVLVSDTHLGYTNGTSRIHKLVGIVNELEPDLVLIAGDLIDDDLRPFLSADMATELSALRSKLGTYAILGNHDARAEQLSAYRAELDRVGIQLLIDETVMVDDSFILVGRNDTTMPRASSGAVAPLDALVQDADRALPLLVMDHNPIRLADAVAVGADVQVSGHTHAGQMFPFTLITSRTYGQDWGYLQRESTHVVISSGFGTWGPPIRVGTRPEVVRLQLTFAAPGDA